MGLIAGARQITQPSHEMPPPILLYQPARGRTLIKRDDAEEFTTRAFISTLGAFFDTPRLHEDMISFSSTPADEMPIPS